MMTRPQLIKEVRDPSGRVRAKTLLNNLREHNNESLWADAFVEALVYKKHSLARKLFEDPEFNVRSDKECTFCLAEAAGSGPEGFLKGMYQQRPHMFTPSSIRAALTACVKNGKLQTAQSMIRPHESSLLLYKGFLPSASVSAAVLADPEFDQELLTALAEAPPGDSKVKETYQWIAGMVVALRADARNASAAIREQHMAQQMEDSLAQQALHEQAALQRHQENIIAEKRLEAQKRAVEKTVKTRLQINRHSSAADHAEAIRLRAQLMRWRSQNPEHLRDRPSLPELVEESFAHRENSARLVERVAQAWKDDEGEFTVKRLIAHCREKLVEKKKTITLSDKNIEHWLEVPNTKTSGLIPGMDFFAQASDMSQEQQNMLWRMKRGSFSTEADIWAIVKAGNRSALFNRLYKDSGIPERVLMHISRLGLDHLKSPGTPLKNPGRTKILVETLYPFRDNSGKSNMLRQNIEELFLDRKVPQTLSDLMLTAMEKEGPPQKTFLGMIVGAKGFKGISPRTGEELAAILSTPEHPIGVNDANHIRRGRIPVRESRAHIFIDLAEKGNVSVSPEEREEAVAFLTGSPSPSQLLKDVVYGRIETGTAKRNPLNSLSVSDMIAQYRNRLGISEKNMVPSVSVIVFQALRKTGKMDYDSAHKFARYFQFTPEETRLFALTAVGEPIIHDFNPLIEQLKHGDIERPEGLRLLVAQTGETVRQLTLNYRDERYPNGIPKTTIQKWLQMGFITHEPFLDYLAEKLFIPERADDLKYIFHARSRSEETPFVQRLEEERKKTLSAIATQITNLPPR